MENQQEVKLENPIQIPEKLRPNKINKKYFIFGVIIGVFLIIVLSIFYYNFITPKITQNPKTATNFMFAHNTPTPTPFLFSEMTIPQLRQKSYVSTLSALNLDSENESYKSYTTSYTSDGFNINAQLTIPQGQTPSGGFPAVIFIHGYIPPANYQTLVNYASYVDTLARGGFVVFKIDLRGHGNSGGEPSGAYYSEDYIEDVLNAKAALSSSEFVNREKIGLWGHSMAGNVVFRTLAVDPTISAAVIWAGAVYTYEDWQKYGIQDGSYQPPSNDALRQRRRRLLFDTHGEFNPTSEYWKQVVATNYLSDIKTPLQLNHAVNDDVVNIGYSRDLNNLLNQTNIVHELKEYSSGGHNISGDAFNQAMNNTVRFFETHL